MNRKTQDKMAILAIHLFTWLTVLLLILILGYVFFRGVWKREIVEYDRFEGETNGYVVSSDEKEVELDWEGLRKIARGRMTSWRTINGNDMPLTLFIEDSVRAQLAKDLDLAEESLAQGSENSGKFPKGSVVVSQSVPKGMREISVRNQVLAVNPSVTALRGNKQLTTLDKADMEGLLEGKFHMWSEVGGPEMEAVRVSDLSQLTSIDGAYMVMSSENFSNAEGLSSLKVREVKEGPNLTLSFLTQNTVESGKYGGIRTIILNTVIFILLVTLVAAPLGIASAVYLEEYAKRGKLYHVVAMGIDILGGIPSIIFGLFGMLVFVEKFHWGFCLASGTLTVSLMVLPTIVRTSQNAIHAVPHALREGSLALGATRIETIWKVVIPAARRGIVTGLILALGRAVGETAALIYTIGSGTSLATNPGMPCRPLAMHIYLTITEGQGMDKAFATALVLMVLVFVFDISANRLTAGKEHV